MTQAREPLLAALGAEALRLQKAAEDATAAVARETVLTLEAIERRGRADRQAFFRRNLMVVAAQAVAVLLLVVIALWNRSTLSAVRSCTEPTGTCAQRAASQQVVALSALVFCDRHLPVAASPARVSACLTAALRDFGQSSTP